MEAIMAKFKSNSVIAWSVNTAARSLTATVKGVGDITLNLSTVSQANLDYAAFHGLKQRLTDAAAIGRDEESGASATPQEKYDAIMRVRDHLASGSADWRLRGEAGDRGEQSIIVQALARVQRTDEATIREKVEAMAEKRGVKPAAVLRKLATAPDVARAIDAIRAERGFAADAEDLLEELNG
jgi:hypothetical protein